MIALFAFVAGFIYDLPLSYFIFGFIALLMDAPSQVNRNNDRQQ